MESKDEINNFKQHCDKFLDYVIKYSYKENNQIEKERIAFLNGVISEQCFNKLKNARQQNILSYNSLAYKFKKASEHDNLKNDEIRNKLNDILQVMISYCESCIQ